MLFIDEKIAQRAHTKFLAIIKQIKPFCKKKFMKIILNKSLEIFIIYILAFQASKITITFFQIMQLINNNFMQILTLQKDKALTKILFKYLNYADVTLFDLVMELLKHTDINKYAIE